MMLTEAQWELLLPILKKSRDNRFKKQGRPFTHSYKAIMEGVLWILKTGARWQDLPKQYPPHQTCYHRYRQWVDAGVMEKALKALSKDLKKRGGLDLTECFIDGTFIPAKKGESLWVQPNGARVRNSWQLQTALLLQWPFVQVLLHPTKLPSLSKRLKGIRLANLIS